jgi:RNA polymerase sigma-70 factor (ECF subfamily)
MDSDSQAWLRALRTDGAARDRTVAALNDLLLRVARAEAARRRPNLPERVHGDLDDLCSQAASDASVAVLGKLEEFEGRARFTTWACKFVILELSSTLRRHVWRGRPVEPDETIWERLPDTNPGPLETVQNRDMLAALRRAVLEDLSERQRFVFQAAVLNEVPIDVLAERLDSTRGAIYKVIHDARRKLREAVARAGYGEELAV